MFRFLNGKIRPLLAGTYWVLAGLVFLSSCAVVEPPPGGPVDTQPPFVTFMFPDSGATGVGQIDKLRIVFSEKMDRQSAAMWLNFFPDQRIHKTKWKGATVAEIQLEEPLPADTLFVVEISAGMRDAHKVKSRFGRRYPLATADTIASGSLSGVLILEDGPLTDGVVELYGTQPDSVDYFQRDMVRRTVTNEQGAYRFDWLPVPGGPWLARAYSDPDGNLRPGDREAQRLIPDTLRVSAEEKDAVVGVTTLYKFDTPGRLLAGPFSEPLYDGRVMAFTAVISDADTGYVPVPLMATQRPMSTLQPDSGGVVAEVAPGINRLIVFVDVDADSNFSVLADTSLGSEVAALTDTVTWYNEPWTMLEGLIVEPGLPTTFEMPVWADSLTVAPAPPVLETLPALDDSLSVNLPDSLISNPGEPSEKQ